MGEIMQKYRVIYQTSLSELHQKAALSSAPENLDVVIRRNPSREEMIELIRSVILYNKRKRLPFKSIE